MVSASAFGGIGEAEIFDRGNYLKPGAYALQVKKLLLKQTRKSGPAFIAEFVILHSHGDDANAVGSKATWFQKMQDKDVALPAIKEFMLSLLGVDKNDKEQMAEFNEGLQELLEEATEYEGPDEDEDGKPLRPFYNDTIRADCYMKKTQKNADFTAHDWQQWSEEDGWKVE